MTKKEWEDFIHSEHAVGTRVRVEVPPRERATWPALPIKGLRGLIVQFDPSIPEMATGVVTGVSNCGWLKVEIPDIGEMDIPGWYLTEAT